MADKQSGMKFDREFVQKLLLGVGLLFGVFWAGIGISGAKGSWVDVVSNVLLIILVACGALSAFVPKSDSSK